ncbi:coenzyme PQQ synthesis protein D (Coenzyme PQQ synthesis protein II) [Acinetobacter baylyi ADP1]|uniref:PqqA binding protein n=2 Tax=Moraxellaceae TaxID=468 RepID=PQQD_ACIAD|nr:RecName: Full=PqqA binding protein; AltName: Full=Coenzyme PQQ synthesis protein D; AltName: Full=Pyrroloquinoline quinone biosynthesis protein D [Acinetobacter baylyi ADP1]CAG69274.1 coenzyme PQQ synthesis protein D (Coenzyme PQQ synthesis protein II) [Acinetobacter baylyi ADP1]
MASKRIIRMSDLLHTTPVFNRGYRFQWEQAQQSYVILYPEGLVRLNESATLILKQIDGKLTVHDIIQNLSAQFPDATGLDQDIVEFLKQAESRQWICLQ